MALSRTEVVLLLSGRCNLACAYCYQDRRQVRRTMNWKTLRAATEAALGSGREEVAVEFTGGEPLLEVALLQRAVRFLEGHRARDTEVSFSLTTNGTMLTPRLASWLFAHRFKIRLSADGISAIQGLRGSGAFEALDRVFDFLRADFARQFRERVTVNATLVAAAIPDLAASVRYLVEKGVAGIGVGPRITWDPEWSPSCRDELLEQVDEVLEFSVEHWRRTGDVPVGFLARPPLRDPGAPVADFLCSAPAGAGFCVDPDGRAMACPLFGGSLGKLPALAEEVAHALDLGLVTDRALMDRLDSLPETARRRRVFVGKRAKRSSYGSCGDCRFASDCRVCPASICHIPDNRDPDLVPDFVCAFNQVTLAARERFDEMTGGERDAAWYAQVSETLRQLGEAIERNHARAGLGRMGRRPDAPDGGRKRRANRGRPRAITARGNG